MESRPKVEVVIPAARGNLCQRLITTLESQTRPPDGVLVVGNEATSVHSDRLAVQMLHYTSDYVMGPGDVCLRRNIGAYYSDADIIIFQDDDQLAPPNMIEAAVDVIDRDGYVWGHHRYIDFGDDWRQIVDLPPEMGRSRETEPNRTHLWQSCFAGMFGVKRDVFLAIDGFDMAFQGRIGNEDQQLGRRLINWATGGDTVFIYEPPFAWHNTSIEVDLDRPTPPMDFPYAKVMNSPTAVDPFDPERVEVEAVSAVAS